LRNYSFFDWLHGYVYARWPYLYIGIGTGEHPLARIVAPVANWIFSLGGEAGTSFADTYHGKVVPLEEATRLVTIDEPVHLTDLETIVPYTRARDIILHNPEHIIVLECPCRAARPNPCHPLDVCLIVGEPFAGFVIEHHPRRSRWITPDEAIEILHAEAERGHVHHVFFKDAMLDRFYAICNCCDCCCGAMQAHRNDVPMLASSGYVCQADTEACIGCGTCVEICPFGALALDEGVVAIDAAECMGCGVCVPQCQQEALALVRAPEKGIPLEIQKLMDQVA
jgi:ferredoxin